MPYIKPEARPRIDDLIAPLVDHVRSLPIEEQDGALNYAITRTLLSIYPRRYYHYNRMMGLLACVTQEAYRVIVGPYEDLKIAENGPVEPSRGRAQPG